MKTKIFIYIILLATNLGLFSLADAFQSEESESQNSKKRPFPERDDPQNSMKHPFLKRDDIQSSTKPSFPERDDTQSFRKRPSPERNDTQSSTKHQHSTVSSTYVQSTSRDTVQGIKDYLNVMFYQARNTNNIILDMSQATQQRTQQVFDADQAARDTVLADIALRDLMDDEKIKRDEEAFERLVKRRKGLLILH